MIKIYGPVQSSAGRCIWLLEELGVPYERPELDMMKGDHKKPEYLKLNPNGKVPTMVDGDFVLFESGAINYYLAAKYKPELLGNTLEEKALIQQWSHWMFTEYQIQVIRWYMHAHVYQGERHDPKVIENAKAVLPSMHQMLDNHLAGKTYMVAERFTLADLHLGNMVGINRHLPNDISAYKNIGQWLERVISRPAFKKAYSLK